MWLGIGAIAYVIFMVFVLLFLKGASARKTPPVPDVPRVIPKPITAEPAIPILAANSDDFAGTVNWEGLHPAV